MLELEARWILILVVDVRMITKIRPKRDHYCKIKISFVVWNRSQFDHVVGPRTKVGLKLAIYKNQLVASNGRTIVTLALSTEKIWSRTLEPKPKQSRYTRYAHGPNASSNSHHASMRPHQKGGSSPWEDSVEFVSLFVHHTFSWQRYVRGPYMLVTCFALWADFTALHAVWHTGGTYIVHADYEHTEETRVMVLHMVRLMHVNMQAGQKIA